MAITRATIRANVRVIADVGAAFVSDATLNSWLIQATGALYDILLSAYGADHFMVHAWLNVDNNSVNAADVWPGLLPRLWPQQERNIEQPGAPSSYLLPSDFSRAVRIRWGTGVVQQGATAYALPAHVAPYTGTATAGDTYLNNGVSVSEMRDMERLDLANRHLDLAPRAWTEGGAAYAIRWARTDSPTASGTPGAVGYTAGSPTWGWVLDLYPPVPDGSQYVVQLGYIPGAYTPADDVIAYPYEPWVDWIELELACRVIEAQGRSSSAERTQQQRVERGIMTQAAPVDRSHPRQMGSGLPYYQEPTLLWRASR